MQIIVSTFSVFGGPSFLFNFLSSALYKFFHLWFSSINLFSGVTAEDTQTDWPSSFFIFLIISLLFLGSGSILEQTYYYLFPIIESFSSQWSDKLNEIFIWILIPASNYIFKVNNRNTRTRCQMFKVNNKDTRTTPLSSFWCLYC